MKKKMFSQIKKIQKIFIKKQILTDKKDSKNFHEKKIFSQIKRIQKSFHEKKEILTNKKVFMKKKRFLQMITKKNNCG